MGVCTDGQRFCHFPASRFVDGGYVDNTALAVLVGHLQQKHGMDTTLEIITQVANACDSHDDCKDKAGFNLGTPSRTSYPEPNPNWKAEFNSDSLQNFFDTPMGRADIQDNGSFKVPCSRGVTLTLTLTLTLQGPVPSEEDLCRQAAGAPKSPW